MKVPLSLSVYEHAARFLGKSPWEVSRDGGLLADAHAAAYAAYAHAPVVVGIDIYNLEAEAYGCRVERPEGNSIPAIVQHPCGSVTEVASLPPLDPERAGRLPMVLDAGRRLKASLPAADVRIPVSGPFSLAANLVGLNTLLLESALEPDATRAALHALVQGQVRFAEAIAANGLDVAFFESAAAPPLLSPAQFRELELPPLREAMERVAGVVGHAVPCIIGGDTSTIVPEMLATGTDFLICPAETDREAFIEAMAPRPDVAVRINLDPRTYAQGTREAITAEIDAILALKDRHPRLLLGTGSIPYETPPETILFIKEYVV